MKISCPECQQHYEIDQPNPDGRYQCHFCGKQFALDEAPRLDEANATSPSGTLPAQKLPSRSVAFAALFLAALALLGVILIFMQPRQSAQPDAAVQSLQADNEALRTQLTALQQELDGLKQKPQKVEGLSDTDRKTINDVSLTVEGVRAWQSRYTPMLDQMMVILENQSLEQAFAQLNAKIDRLYAPQGDLARVYLAINQLSNATTENLVILNTNIAQLTAYSETLAGSIAKQGEEFNKLNRDIGNLFGRVRSLERNGPGIIFVPSSIQPPPPKPPQPRSAVALPIAK